MSIINHEPLEDRKISHASLHACRAHVQHFSRVVISINDITFSSRLQILELLISKYFVHLALYHEEIGRNMVIVIHT